MSEELRDVTTRGALVAVAVGVLVVALLIGIAVFRGSTIVSQAPNKDRQQAIFLTNGQVYFGKLSGLGSAYVTISDVYQVQQQAAGASPSPAPGGLSLVARTSALHGPEPQMSVASDQILFYEDLKDDSEVAKLIKQDQEKK